VHCYCQGLSPEFSGGKSELTLNERKSLLDQLAEAGALHLAISGGEVLLHPDFFEIAHYAKKRSFCISIFTNGTLLDRTAALRIKEIAPRMVALSIYGPTADVHDSITCCKGSFDGTIRAIRLLKDLGIRVELRSVIMEQNYRQADGIEALSKTIGADDYSFNIEISRKNDGSPASQKCQMKDETVRSFMKERSGFLPEGGHKYDVEPLKRPLCATGLLVCYISPYGDVYPCIQLLRSMGNIREKSFKEIWHARSSLRCELEELKTYGDIPPCRTCEYLDSCRFCMGIAFSETGDMKRCYNTLRLISGTEHEIALSKKGGSYGKKDI